MGNDTSTPLDSAIVRKFNMYSCLGLTSLQSIRYQIAQLANSQLDEIGGILDEEDLKVWTELVTEKRRFLNKARSFATLTHKKLGFVLARLQNSQSLKSSYRSWNSADTVKKSKELHEACTELQGKFEVFQNRFFHKYVKDAQTKRIQLAIGYTITALLGIALIALHIIPGVNVVFGTATVAFLGTTAAASTITAGILWFSKTEVEKITGFLKNIKRNLDKLNSALDNVTQSNEVLTGLDRKEICSEIKKMMKECDNIKEACSKISTNCY